jgi:hypothetical protein
MLVLSPAFGTESPNTIAAAANHLSGDCCDRCHSRLRYELQKLQTFTAWLAGIMLSSGCAERMHAAAGSTLVMTTDQYMPGTLGQEW